MIQALAAQSSGAWVGNSVTGSSAPQALVKDEAFRKSGSLSDLQASPATGAAQLMTLAMNKTGYNPSNPAEAGSAAAFNGYVAEVVSSSLFSTLINDTVAPTFSGPWASIVTQMASQFVGIAQSDLQALEGSMLRLGNAAASSPSTWEKMNLIAQSAINVEGEGIDVFIYQTFIQMITVVHKGGKHEPDTASNQANMQLHRVKLSFDASKWAAAAAAVQKQTNASLKSWAAANS